jgi:hypothetical protein
MADVVTAGLWFVLVFTVVCACGLPWILRGKP